MGKMKSPVLSATSVPTSAMTVETLTATDFLIPQAVATASATVPFEKMKNEILRKPLRENYHWIFDNSSILLTQLSESMSSKASKMEPFLPFPRFT